jgi:membrane protein DedA with SNARE-associated domain
MVICGYIADALWPTLVESNPLLLIGLSAKNRYLVLVVNNVSLVWYYVIGTLRLLAPDPLFFLIGWFYGQAALRWMERRTPTIGSFMSRLERWFPRFSWPIVLLFPNNYVCLIAGAARMSPVLFLTLDVFGTLGRLLMIQVIGDVFAGPVSSFLGFVSTWRIPILIVTIGLVALSTLGEFRRGNREMDALHDLEDVADEVALAVAEEVEARAVDQRDAARGVDADDAGADARADAGTDAGAAAFAGGGDAAAAVGDARAPPRRHPPPQPPAGREGAAAQRPGRAHPAAAGLRGRRCGPVAGW